MNIKVIRKIKTENSTIGELFIDGIYLCHTLEDRDRDLKQTDTLDHINSTKVFGLTCIPTGEYKVIINKSNRFSQLTGHDVFLPLLINVLGYEGVRIHAGNKPEDTEGCILVGLTYNPEIKDFIGTSKIALEKVLEKLKDQQDIKINII